MNDAPNQSVALPPVARRHLGLRLSTAREFRGIEPARIEAALGERAGFIARLESPEQTFAAEDLHRLMRHLDIGVRFFYDGAPESVRSAIAETMERNCAPGSMREVIVFLSLLSAKT